MIYQAAKSLKQAPNSLLNTSMAPNTRSAMNRFHDNISSPTAVKLPDILMFSEQVDCAKKVQQKVDRK